MIQVRAKETERAQASRSNSIKQFNTNAQRLR
jgi:hypothetical protein